MLASAQQKALDEALHAIGLRGEEVRTDTSV